MLNRGPDAVAAAASLADALFRRGEEIDHGGVFPREALRDLAEAGLLLAPFAAEHGGAGLTEPARAEALFEALRCVGAGDLSVGRLYEGHVNAVALVRRFGTPAQACALADAVRDGEISAVWNAEGRVGARLEREGDGWLLRGGKVLASGAGDVTVPLVTATLDGEVWMVLPRLERGTRADLAAWRPQGMRSSATGAIDLDGIRIGPDEIVGGPGDYKRQPFFSGGAWRFCAVQLGAAERLLDLFRDALVARGRGDDPYQRQRVAAAAIAAEAAALAIAKAARLAAAESLAPEATVAYVGLVRTLTERAALDIIELVHKGIGLASFIEPNPVERVARDLATYLRQPAPDGAMADAAAVVLASERPARDLWREV